MAATTLSMVIQVVERIQVKAGAFMAFRIDGEDKRLDRRHGILINLWYSPEAKVIVKMESVDGSNNQPIAGGTFELIKLSQAN